MIKLAIVILNRKYSRANFLINSKKAQKLATEISIQMNLEMMCISLFSHEVSFFKSNFDFNVGKSNKRAHKSYADDIKSKSRISIKNNQK